MTSEEFYEALNKNRAVSQQNLADAINKIPPEARSNNWVMMSRVISAAMDEAQNSLIKTLCDAGVIKFDD